MAVLKRCKYDEYYTLYENIEKIYKTDGYMQPSIFNDKIIYCNCDDYRWSNYVKFWKDNFDYFNLRQLVATNYDIGDGAYIYTYDGKEEVIYEGREDGSYEQYEDFVCDDVIITTNPPFSDLKNYLDFLQRTDAKFYVHSTLLKSVNFYKNLNELLFIFNGALNEYKIDDHLAHVAASGVMTNVGLDRSASKVTLTKTFDEVEHDFYYPEDIYNKSEWKDKILNVDRSNKIPYDYDGWMGVPISFIAVQPEIRAKYHIYGLIFYGHKFHRLRIKKIKE